jgi:hypothetical protein
MTDTSAADHETELSHAAERLYDAEIALHIARQTGVDRWINSAADRLHDALVVHVALCGAPAVVVDNTVTGDDVASHDAPATGCRLRCSHQDVLDPLPCRRPEGRRTAR